jgi:hypothetical protein
MNKRNFTRELRAVAMSATFILLYGCGSAPTKAPDPLPIVQPDKQVNIDPYLLQDCPKISHVPVQAYTQGQTLTPTKTFLDMYSECAGKHAKLSRLAASAFNLDASAPVAASAPATK